MTKQANKLWWIVLRSVIDAIAIYFAFAIQFAASGSKSAALITAIAVGLYGCFCFFDGNRK